MPPPTGLPSRTAMPRRKRCPSRRHPHSDMRAIHGTDIFGGLRRLPWLLVVLSPSGPSGTSAHHVTPRSPLPLAGCSPSQSLPSNENFARGLVSVQRASTHTCREIISLWCGPRASPRAARCSAAWAPSRALAASIRPRSCVHRSHGCTASYVAGHLPLGSLATAILLTLSYAFVCVCVVPLPSQAS